MAQRLAHAQLALGGAIVAMVVTPAAAAAGGGGRSGVRTVGRAMGHLILLSFAARHRAHNSEEKDRGLPNPA